MTPRFRFILHRKNNTVRGVIFLVEMLSLLEIRILQTLG